MQQFLLWPYKPQLLILQHFHKYVLLSCGSIRLAFLHLLNEVEYEPSHERLTQLGLAFSYYGNTNTPCEICFLIVSNFQPLLLPDIHLRANIMTCLELLKGKQSLSCKNIPENDETWFLLNYFSLQSFIMGKKVS